MKKSLIIILSLVFPLVMRAQTLLWVAPDSIMEVLSGRVSHDNWRSCLPNMVEMGSVMFQREPEKMTYNREAFNLPPIYVPDPPPLFEDDDCPSSLGEALFLGVLNGLADGLTSSKKKKKHVRH
ncbi:MAG: hypothetical protein IJV33_02705 [Bacteroidaceae bacterium]|nr:hypothetical protein [Bacteroidaceae bacterium]